MQFQDLESIRESMRRLSLAHQALCEFLLTYRQYAARVTRERADAVSGAPRPSPRTWKPQKDAHGTSPGSARRAIAAHGALKELEALSQVLAAEVRELSGSPEYSDVSARRQVVHAQRESAASALSQAAARRAAEDMAATAVRSALHHSGQGARAANRAAAAAQASFGRAGWPRPFFPSCLPP